MKGKVLHSSVRLTLSFNRNEPTRIYNSEIHINKIKKNGGKVL